MELRSKRMLFITALIAALIGGVIGRESGADHDTCDAAELAFKAEYASSKSALSVEQDPGGAGFAVVYGDQIYGPEMLSIYVQPGQEKALASLKMERLGTCVNALGTNYIHFIVKELPKAPAKQQTLDHL